MRRLLCISLTCLLFAALSPTANALIGVVASLDTTHLPVNPDNGFAGFNYGQVPNFVPAIISSPVDPTLTLNIPGVDPNGPGPHFGGLGVDFVTQDFGLDPNGDLVEVNQHTLNFDANLATWELRIRVNSGNTATAIRTTMDDVDGAAQNTGIGSGGSLFVEGDEHVWLWDISGLTEGVFHDLTLPVDSPTWSQTAFGKNPGDLISNPGLKVLQIQLHDTSQDLNVDIEYARISVVPEPTSAALMLLGLTAPTALLRRRR